MVLAGIAAALIHRFKVLKRMLRLEQAASLAQERERIARDMHDDLAPASPASPCSAISRGRTRAWSRRRRPRRGHRPDRQPRH